MVDPRLWASLPFNNRNAWIDFTGCFDLWHRALAAKVAALTGTTYKTYPLGNGVGTDWLHAVQRQYQNAAAALGIAPPPDLESYDLDQAGDFASWTFTISQTSRTLARAAGLE